MLRRCMFTIMLVATVVVAAAPALAGGWAVTEFDEPLPGLVAGRSTTVGFTVLQHGRTPVTSGEVGIVLTSSPLGAEVLFPAEPQGAAGHYVADVRPPKSGNWRLTVLQGSLPGFDLAFPAFDAGIVEVAATGTAIGSRVDVSSPPATEPPTVQAAPVRAAASEPAAEDRGSVGTWFLAAAAVLGATLAAVVATRPSRRDPSTGPGTGDGAVVYNDRIEQGSH